MIFNLLLLPTIVYFMQVWLMVFHIKLPGVLNCRNWGKLSEIGFQVENMCNYGQWTHQIYSSLTFGICQFYFRLIVWCRHCVRGMRTVQARPGCACEYWPCIISADHVSRVQLRHVSLRPRPRGVEVGMSPRGEPGSALHHLSPVPQPPGQNHRTLKLTFISHLIFVLLSEEWRVLQWL